MVSPELPGTAKSEGRMPLDTSTDDWKYYTLTFPVVRYAQLSLDESIEEMLRCNEQFYSVGNVMGRIWGNLWRWRGPFITVVANFSYRSNIRLDREAYANFRCENAHRYDPGKGRATA